MWGDIAIAFLLAFITAYVVTPYSIRLARKTGAIDRPKDNKRKIHKRVMPRLGGIAIIAGFAVSVIYLLATMSIEGTIDLNGPEKYYNKLLGFFSGVVILAMFCFLDDTKGIRAYIKLIGQILAAIVVILNGIEIDTIKLSFLNTVISEDILLKIITVIWIVGITNAFNLIDGLDGLSSGIALISSISLIIVFALNSSPIISIVLATALAGALVGFLPFNFNPARTFMGDIGSNFIGFTLAIVSILGTAKTYTALVLIAPLIIFVIPLFDTVLAIIRRIIKTKSLKGVFKADKEHLHHKIMKKGYSQKQAVLFLYGATATLGMFAIILLESGVWKAISFGLMIVAIVAIGYKDILKFGDKDGKDKPSKDI